MTAQERPSSEPGRQRTLEHLPVREPVSAHHRHVSERRRVSIPGRAVLAARHSQHKIPLAIIGLSIVIANAPSLFHLVTTNPLQLFAGLQIHSGSQLLPGQPTIDGNAGWTAQALGHLAINDWFHGHIPWWNPYEGLGSPLAGEMQSAAFFPLVVLMSGTWGFVPFHLILELIAGWATYFLLRRLGTGPVAATVGGIAFGLCGTMAWLANAPVNPVAFLPLALVGAERCLSAARDGRSGGWAVLTIALALSLLAGFPEVTYIDGLFVVLWCAVRLVMTDRGKALFFFKIIGGAVVALMISAPLLVAFLGYLPHANVGGHNGAFGNDYLVSQQLPQVIMPYVYGPINAFRSPTSTNTLLTIWGNAGGYVSAALFVCGLVGLLGSRLRPLRLVLAAWIVVAFLKSYGVQPVARLVTEFPGFHAIATYRYSPPSWEVAMVVLAGLGIDDMARKEVRARTVLVVAGLTIILIALGVSSAWPVLSAATGGPHRHTYALFSGAWAVLTVCAITVGALMTVPTLRRPAHLVQGFDRHRVGILVVAGTVSLDAILLFATPMLSAPRQQPVDLGVVSFLQRNLGLHRFATLGPIAPNYGSYFGIAEVNIKDLPIPSVYSRYLQDQLDVNPLAFMGTTSKSPDGPGPGEELWQHLSEYEALGVKYVVVDSSGTDATRVPWPPANGSSTVTMVYRDSVARVYELPAPAPFFSTLGGKCALTSTDWDTAHVNCDRSVLLVRRELPMPGWTATVAGKGTQVRTTDQVFQEITLPKGNYGVSFSYAPPHIDLAFALSLVGIAILVGFALVNPRRRRWRPSQRSTSATTVTSSRDGSVP
jgi:hypothetical protein